MLKDNLYEEVLKRPAEEIQADGLFIIAGYAFASMALRHMIDLRKIINKREFNLELIVGMVPAKTLQRRDHEGFVKLANQGDNLNFNCSYVYIGEAVHSKLYVWTNDEEPSVSYVGSANYSQKAFFERREVLYSCWPDEALEYYMDIREDTIDCRASDIENFVTIIGNQENELLTDDVTSQNDHKGACSIVNESKKVTLSLLKDDKEIGLRSGLNWGQRPGRESNQAYIPIKSTVWSTDFFPPIGRYFNVFTDDGMHMIFVRAQQNGKALETPQSNSLLGSYLRDRIGVGDGEFVTKEDLDNYGRATIDFYKIDHEYYYMDFSV